MEKTSYEVKIKLTGKDVPEFSVDLGKGVILQAIVYVKGDSNSTLHQMALSDAINGLRDSMVEVEFKKL